MLWITYEILNGNKWEERLESCTSARYEELKKEKGIVITKVEKIKIVS